MGERAEPKGDFPKIFLKKEKQSKKENILSRKEEGNCLRLSIFHKPDTVLGSSFTARDYDPKLDRYNFRDETEAQKA